MEIASERVVEKAPEAPKDLDTLLLAATIEAYLLASKDVRVTSCKKCWGRGHVGRHVNPRTHQPDGLVLCVCAKELMNEHLPRILRETVPVELFTAEKSLRGVEAKAPEICTTSILRYGVVHVKL